MSDPDELKQAAEKFLERDFVQCFTQMRHYDSQNIDLLKFTFTAYTALIGVAVGLYQFSTKEHVDLVPVAAAILGVGFLFGLFIFSLIVRNRVYFVIVARYVNENRRLFLRAKPFGFENRAKMYISSDRPHFFNWRSSQAFHLYLVAVLNSLLASGFLFAILPLWYAIVGFLVVLLTQLVPAGIYLQSRESRSADAAVFGSEGASDITLS